MATITIHLPGGESSQRRRRSRGGALLVIGGAVIGAMLATPAAHITPQIGVKPAVEVPPPPFKPIAPVLEPLNIHFTAPGSKTVTVSNPHDRPITITRIFILGKGAPAVGYDIDSSRCNGRKLAPGDQCTITITAAEEAIRTGSGFQIVVIHDGRRRP